MGEIAARMAIIVTYPVVHSERSGNRSRKFFDPIFRDGNP
jgi:hypothetical protein